MCRETDARIAALAAEQFHEHGITATGVDALSRAAGISKRTLYERFGSKDGLIVAAYDSLDLPVFEMLTGPAEAASDDPRDQLDGALRPARGDGAAAAVPRLPVRQRVVRAGRPDHPAHEVVRRHKDRLRRWIRRRAKDAGAADPERLSRQLMLVFAGAQSQALVQRSPKPVRDARQVARALVDAATA